ncbi:hypothetical protein [Yeosuana marina]|uniref:hypothetical protein n=1 Tax=Yeosuana marina TaxID=1565536 RepID=UPI0030C891E2
MITKPEKLELIRDFFNEFNSKQFLEDIDNALRSIDLDAIARIFKKYKIDHLEDSHDFIGQLKHEFNSLNKEGVEVIFIKKAKPRLSKCMGCSFGHTIRAYTYNYKERYFYPGNKGQDFYDVVYRKEFGVLFKVENNILIDMGFCNAFLTKEECNELNG